MKFISNTPDTKASRTISPEYERFDQSNRLQGETLVRRGTTDIYKNRPPIRLTPHLHVIKVGGHGVIDYGSKVVFPVVEEIGDLSLKHQILVVTGGGVRTRHMLDVGLDLGMPTGVLAELSSKTSDQNATMLALLLAKWQD
jgi:molybdenum storage protein